MSGEIITPVTAPDGEQQIKLTNRFLAFFWCLTALVLGGAIANAQPAKNQFAHLQAEHQTAVKNYIGAKTNLRPAQISDCKNKFGLDSLRQSAGKTAHPYYAAQDFNQDKIQDFAVVLYDSSKKIDARFMILIFNGAKSGAYKLASTTAGADLRQGGIWTYGFGTDEQKTSVTAGVYETDDCMWIGWDGKKYVAHDCAEVEN